MCVCAFIVRRGSQGLIQKGHPFPRMEVDDQRVSEDSQPLEKALEVFVHGCWSKGSLDRSGAAVC